MLRRAPASALEAREVHGACAQQGVALPRRASINTGPEPGGPAAAPLLAGAALRLGQVVQNLLENAMQ